MDELIIEGEASSVSDREAVQIMTVHQAKGLEFDTVFVINAKKRSFPTIPRHPMFAFHDQDGLIINYDRSGDKFFKYKPYDLKKNSHLYQKYGIIDHYERFRQDHLSEERRIWYVAVTRARQLLYLSTPELTTGEVKQGSGTDFFQEIHDAFANAGTICQFRSFKEEIDENQAELPLWKGRDRAAFTSLEEAEEYGKRLMDLVRKRSF